jgi:hypothetical protein
MSSAFQNIWVDQGGTGTCNDTWRPVGKWNRHLVIIDRFFAIVGAIIFTLLFSLSYVIIPGYLLLWFAFAGSRIWSDAALYIAILSATALQCLLAYLREAYFYDSYATYAALGMMLSAFLIGVTTVSMSHMNANYGMTWAHIVTITVFQIVEAMTVGIMM